MWDTSASMLHVNTSPTSHQVSANIYKENFKTDFETASYMKYLIR